MRRQGKSNMSLQSCPMGRVTNSTRPGRGSQKQRGIIAGGNLDFNGSEGHVVKRMGMCRSHCDQSNQNPMNQTLEKHDSWLHGYNRSLLFDLKGDSKLFGCLGRGFSHYVQRQRRGSHISSASQQGRFRRSVSKSSNSSVMAEQRLQLLFCPHRPFSQQQSHQQAVCLRL